MSKLNCAVIGVGYLGRFHAQKYHLLEEANLVGVCDHTPATVALVAEELQVPAFTCHKDLFGKVDAVSIAATTKAHYQIAKDFLEQGIHVLIEKPMTETVQQADELLAIANAQQVKLQIGHIERFNPVRIAAADYLDSPLFIDCQRLAMYTPRGADVNVVLDLMIHDIDLIQTMVNSPIASIEAHGSSVLTSAIDVANARITFENRCVATMTASRLHTAAERSMRVLQSNSYLSMDFHQKKITLFHQNKKETLHPGKLTTAPQNIVVKSSDALKDEIEAFISCILNDTPPIVTGDHGRNALAVAVQISELIEKNLAYHAIPA